MVTTQQKGDDAGCVQRAGLFRQAAMMVAVAMCAYAVCSMYTAGSTQSAVELVQKSHTKHLAHKNMNVSSCTRP